jgi:hypothetical protein
VKPAELEVPEGAHQQTAGGAGAEREARGGDMRSAEECGGGGGRSGATSGRNEELQQLFNSN